MRIRFAGAAAVATAGILLLTACGSDDDGSKAGDEIAGAEKKDKEPSASASPEEKGAPKFDLPSDVKVVIDDDKTGDKAKDEVLKDHGYALMAMQEAYAKAKATGNFDRYWQGEAASKFRAVFDGYRKGGTTITGTDRFYGRAVMSHERKKALVTFCEDQRKAFDKDVKSKKVSRDEPSLDSFIEIRTVLEKGSAGDWKITEYLGQRGSKSCQKDA
ncbi:hypothetical protein [Streptomyces sp. NPDC051776]|uniref:hypothetical protein n=1 Tax=Streptomyces sp. NPDC051776 TaxID=3155414 RepID=UPI00344ABF17